MILLKQCSLTRNVPGFEFPHVGETDFEISEESLNSNMFAHDKHGDGGDAEGGDFDHPSDNSLWFAFRVFGGKVGPF